MMPVIMMGGMLFGIFTPTEAGVIAVVYAYIIARFVNKKMSLKTLRKVLIGSAKSSAVIMFIVAATNALGILITVLQVPQIVAEVLMSISNNPLIIMLIIDVLILILGLFMDVVPAVTLVAPIFLPIVQRLGVWIDFCIGSCHRSPDASCRQLSLNRVQYRQYRPAEFAQESMANGNSIYNCAFPDDYIPWNNHIPS